MAFEIRYYTITMLIHNKDDIEFVTEFPCFLGHPVHSCSTHNAGGLVFFLDMHPNYYKAIYRKKYDS